MNQCYISGVGTVARIMLHYFVTKRTYYGRVIIRFSGSKDKVLGSQVFRGGRNVYRVPGSKVCSDQYQCCFAVKGKE